MFSNHKIKMKMNFVISVRGFSVSIGCHVCNVRLQLTFTLGPLRCTLSEPRVLASYPGHMEKCHGSASCTCLGSDWLGCCGVSGNFAMQDNVVLQPTQRLRSMQVITFTCCCLGTLVENKGHIHTSTVWSAPSHSKFMAPILRSQSSMVEL